MTDLIKAKYEQSPRHWPYYLMIFAVICGVFIWSMTVMNMSGMSEKAQQLQVISLKGFSIRI